MKKIDEMTKEELVALVKEVKKRKKYGLVWEDKPEDVAEQCKRELPILEEIANKEIIKDKDKPVNLLIEGDNYHSLSVLNYTHAGKIDVIYIDPPYNTGNKSWKYNNNYVEKEDNFRHSKWISFMSKRLKLARNLLTKNGIAIVAIDDYEHHTLRLLMDEIFGENNRLGTIVVVHNPRGRNDDKYFATMHEYMLIYSKNAELSSVGYFELTQEDIDFYNMKDDISAFNLASFMRTGNNSNRSTRPKLFYPIYLNTKTNKLSLDKDKNSIEMLPINNAKEEKTWRWGKETFLEKKDTEIIIRKVKDNYRLFKKRRLTDSKGKKPKTVWYDPKYDASSHGIMLLQKMFKTKNVFPYPKSIWANVDILRLVTKKESVVLDFFAGSGTTGHAVMLLNSEDGGQRQFILTTNNEGGIAEEVCYPRIKKVIEGYSETKGISANLRYFKTGFVSKSKVSDDTRRELVKRSTEMICVRENTFEKIEDKKSFKIYKDSTHVTGVLCDLDALETFKDKLQEQKLPAHIYVFSLTNDTFNDDFEDLRLEHELCPIPESILEVYRKLFK